MTSFFNVIFCLAVRMKLYSITILYKDANGKSKTLKHASDLSSFSFFYKKTVGVSRLFVVFKNTFDF
jgi:hypothetical protein